MLMVVPVAQRIFMCARVFYCLEITIDLVVGNRISMLTFWARIGTNSRCISLSLEMCNLRR